jgi:NADPH-dependent 2,4-dienoyl-CoA reductase/sulfur reductase-like enzyme
MPDYLIIGADAAGLSAAVQIRLSQPKASIKVINMGETISYGACGIPYVISGDISSPEALIHFTPESFARMRGVSVETGLRAVALDPDSHTVTILDMKTGEERKESFGKLLIATGSLPKRLPFLDYSQPGIFNVHTIPDLRAILRFLEESRPGRAAIIGAGNVGLEVAEALHKRGTDVHLFEALEVPAAMWPPLIQKAVLKKIKEKGLGFSPSTSITGVSRNGGDFEIRTEKGAHRADAIFSVVGTGPATDFCRDHLDCLKNGAVIIDEKGRTSRPDIYAAGDCATVHHKLLGRQAYLPLGSTANKMGRIAGMNMAGRDIPFPGVVGTQILKFFELSLAKTGLDLKEAEGEGIAAESFSARRMDKSGYYPGAAPVRVEVVSDKKTARIIGAAAVCESNAAQFIDTAAAAVFSGMTIQDLGWFDAAYAPPFAPVWNALISAALKGTR